jgi:hypothetical protein
VKTFLPRRETLPPAQIALWPELAPFGRAGFVLYGGTALALRLGHRESVDFDFFTERPLRKEDVLRTGLLQGGKVVQDAADTLSLVVERAGQPVKVSFFGDLVPARIAGRVGEPERTDDDVIVVASIDDLFAMKVKVVLDRAEAKDYLDIAALLRAGHSLERGLGAARTIYGSAFQSADSLKALAYFGDGDLASLSIADQTLLTTAAAALREVPYVALRAGILGEAATDLSAP